MNIQETGCEDVNRNELDQNSGINGVEPPETVSYSGIIMHDRVSTSILPLPP
jgi:hypothetical protein